jgi:hypothetical protein
MRSTSIHHPSGEASMKIDASSIAEGDKAA